MNDSWFAEAGIALANHVLLGVGKDSSAAGGAVLQHMALYSYVRLL